MREIPLTRGKYAIVDDEDYEWLNQWKWYFNYWGYAERTTHEKGKKLNIGMHRFLLNPPNNMLVDHRNGNSLDNRKCNLRIATKQQNAQNQKLNKNNTSGYKGVTFNRLNNNWMAQIMVKRKNYHLGSFGTAIEAARAYEKAALQYFGEFAKVINLSEN